MDDSDDMKVILAPMVRGSELAYRTLVRRHGVSAVYSPMVRAAEVVKAYHQSWNITGDSSRVAHEDGFIFLDDICVDRQPVVVQLCGHCPATLHAAVLVLLELAVPDAIVGIDFNLGW